MVLNSRFHIYGGRNPPDDGAAGMSSVMFSAIDGSPEITPPSRSSGTIRTRARMFPKPLSEPIRVNVHTENWVDELPLAQISDRVRIKYASRI